MSRQKIIITLSLKDQKFLEQLLSKGTAPARTIRRAQILLNSNRKGKKQYTAEELADLLSTKKQTVSRVLKEYEVSGIECFTDYYGVHFDVQELGALLLKLM